MPEKDPLLLKGEDFLRDGEYRKYEMTIESAEHITRDSSEGPTDGLLLRFVGANKPLFCPDGKLNQRLLKAETGTDNANDLAGNKITMIPVMGDWFGERNTLAVRILVTGNKPKPGIKSSAFGTPVNGMRIGGGE